MPESMPGASHSCVGTPGSGSRAVLRWMQFVNVTISPNLWQGPRCSLRRQARELCQHAAVLLRSIEGMAGGFALLRATATAMATGTGLGIGEDILNRRGLDRFLRFELLCEAQYLSRSNRSLPFGHTIVCPALKPR